MVKFDSDSIYQRVIEKLQQDPNWSVITNNSVISALVRQNAEVLSETARYSEYLFKESKWDTAQNTSSILGMANMLGYQPKRKVSASGTIVVSPDPRIHQVGYTYSSKAFKNIIGVDNVPGWGMATKDIVIDQNWKITDALGSEYVPVPIGFPQNKSAVEIGIIQGKLSTVDIPLDVMQTSATQSKLNPYLYIPVTISNCEDAGTAATKGLFTVTVVYKSTPGHASYSREYRVINSLLLTEATDYDVEVYNDMYSRELFYLKFNNDPSLGPVLDLSSSSSISKITVQYLETKGASGNRENLYTPFTLTGPDNTVLYGINLAPISGGKDVESISDIKENAPKFYMANYTAGTKEAYENILSSLKVPVKNKILTLSKVNVYRETYVSESNDTDAENNATYRDRYPVTAVTFIAKDLESLLAENPTDEICDEIDEYLNAYLDKIKSPQDLIKFYPPEYTPFALGVSCKVDKTRVEDLNQLAASIQADIDAAWGPKMDQLQFSRNFYSPQIVASILNKYPEVVSVATELEAVTRVRWSEATRVTLPRESNTSAAGSSTAIMHGIRVPYAFDTVFLGTKATQGFRDYRTDAKYSMRIDFIYHKPNALKDNRTYGVTVFIPEDGNRNKDPFYSYISSDDYWMPKLFENEAYDYNLLTKAYPYNAKDPSAAYTGVTPIQVAYRGQLYTDKDFQSLTEGIVAGTITNYVSHSVNLGAIDNLLVYNSGDLEGAAGNINSGWLEMDFDSLYDVLAVFSMFDGELKSMLSSCSKNNLKCLNDANSNEFATFKDILAKYLDVYVAMRPIDGDIIYKGRDDKKRTVLYIDSYDSSSSGTSLSNISEMKKPRMISVNCRYEE